MGNAKEMVRLLPIDMPGEGHSPVHRAAITSLHLLALMCF